MKFAMSYSGGKDSAFALHRAVESGHTTTLLITTYNADQERSWFHGIPSELLGRVSEALGIPIKTVVTRPSDDYGLDLEAALREEKSGRGIDACVFGDIDIEAHRKWCRERCANVDIEALFPLWNGDRRALTDELISLGFKAMITIVDTKALPAEFLGKTLTPEVVSAIEGCGADACGENGEYHTFVYDGPVFTKPVEFRVGERTHSGDYAILPVLP
ncbi:MAG: diphthine--ammonia ligase [Clostridiales Family XIII bacterium]|jgi:uncharacterized protein (TIGR00290 family)|nr:diphthine--ammonia ligase [Clostridiales Family XIII bacterium]